MALAIMSAVAEKLGQKFDVRCFAATRASAGEFEQGSRSCESFTCEWEMRLRSNSGSPRKYSQFTLSG